MNSERYSKQISLPEFGVDGQQKLEDASVLIIGVGGIGTTLMYTLAAAGVGTIGIADHNIISINDLNNQYIHFEDDIGSLKVNSAAKKLRAFNSLVNVIPHATAINKDNAYEVISQYDIVAIAVDNTQARMIVNQACVELEKPLVDAVANGFCGTCTFIDPAETACLACLYGEETPPEDSFNSLSAVESTLASIEATSILQFILGLEIPLKGQLLYYDALTMTVEKTPLNSNDTCPVCGIAAKEEY
ncbi:MAG: HesA/MoeB/ThiF family protein [Clostridia bacterium]|nr:HesA/MoeB/ThiF family protein [Clostridia bacterium]